MTRCIDFHTHIFPDHVADRAVESLRQVYQAEPEGPPTVAGLTAAMEEAGVERAVICPVATRPEQVKSINRWVVGLDRSRFIPLGAMHPQFDQQEEELAFLRDHGVVGVKLQPHFQGFNLDDAAALRMMERLEDMVIVIHAGQEIRPIPQVPTTPRRLRRLHERFPTHRLVLAHLGGFRMWNEVEAYLVGQQVYMDLAFTFGHLDDAAIKRLISRHGAGRILFASDYPWQRPAVARAGLERLDLPPQQEQMILSGNAVQLLGL